MTSFWLQTQAPAGNYCDNLGKHLPNPSTQAELSAALNTLLSHADYLTSQGQTVRIVERNDIQVYP